MTGKFRLYNKKKECYDTESNLFINPCGRVMHYDRNAKPCRWKDVTDRYDIEWEIGRRDSKGVEIHQGDRCKNGDYVPDAAAWNYREEEVYWNPEGAAWMGWNYNENGMCCKIIGNIHDE